MNVPRVGISACLLGRNVRYDGGHRREVFFADRLGAHVEWVPICPEEEIGLGTPRSRIDLWQSASAVEPRMIQDGRDITNRMEKYARRRLSDPDVAGSVSGGGVAQAAPDEETSGSWAPLCGYVFKARSPSCGIRDVRLLMQEGTVREDGVGLFARAFHERYPETPIFDEAVFADPYASEAAVTALFTMHRWQRAGKGGGTTAEFHRTHRTLLLSRDPTALARLDRLVGSTSDPVAAEETTFAPPDTELRLRYGRWLAELLQRVPGRRDHERALAALVDEIGALLPPGGREGREVRAVAQHLVRRYPGESDLAGVITALAELAELHVPGRLQDAYLTPHPAALSLYRGL